jgi:hypothetical protein
MPASVATGPLPTGRALGVGWYADVSARLRLAEFGDYYVVAEVKLDELEEVAMALVPGTRTRVGVKRLNGLLDMGAGKPGETDAPARTAGSRYAAGRRQNAP